MIFNTCQSIKFINVATILYRVDVGVIDKAMATTSIKEELPYAWLKNALCGKLKGTHHGYKVALIDALCDLFLISIELLAMYVHIRF